MSVDHSLTYKKIDFRNIPHILRENKIYKLLKSVGLNSEKSLLDIGCSNGYITEKLRSKFDLSKVMGVDFDEVNISIAQNKYAKINFSTKNINQEFESDGVIGFDYVTCFETLEHSGPPEITVKNILNVCSKSEKLIISLPIETGFIGAAKFIIKNFIYKDDFSEIGGSKFEYFISLLANKRISKFRDERMFWATHYGFDYRDILDILNRNSIKVTLIKSFTTVFIIASFDNE